jgi:hypothetical protein
MTDTPVGQLRWSLLNRGSVENAAGSVENAAKRVQKGARNVLEKN